MASSPEKIQPWKALLSQPESKPYNSTMASRLQTAEEEINSKGDVRLLAEKDAHSVEGDTHGDVRLIAEKDVHSYDPDKDEM